MVVYLRLTYALEFVAASSLLLALFLPWHNTTHSAASLLYTVLAQLNDPNRIESLAIPGWFVLLLMPVVILGMLRGLLGVIDRRKMALLKTTRRAAYLAALPLIWFYANEHELATFAAERIGHLQFGFWLSTSSAVLLFVLLLIETSLPDRIGYRQYVACPICDQTVRRGTRRCPHCGQLIFTG